MVSRVHRKAQGGVTLLEFVLVALVFSLVVFASLDRLAAMLDGENRLMVDIEAVTLKHTVNVMKTALAIETGRAHAQGQSASLDEWEGGNALELIQSRDMLQGVFVDMLPGPGSWSYEAEQGQVVYDPAYLESAEADGRWRWRVASEQGNLVLRPVAVAGLNGAVPE